MYSLERAVQLMLTQEDLQAISQLIKNEVEPINKRLDKMDLRFENMDSRFENIENDISSLKSDVAEMKEDIEIIKEDCEITRDVTNKLGEWVDFYFHDDTPYPLDEDEIEKYKDRIKFAK